MHLYIFFYINFAEYEPKALRVIFFFVRKKKNSKPQNSYARIFNCGTRNCNLVLVVEKHFVTEILISRWELFVYRKNRIRLFFPLQKKSFNGPDVWRSRRSSFRFFFAVLSAWKKKGNFKRKGKYIFQVLRSFEKEFHKGIFELVE